MARQETLVTEPSAAFDLMLMMGARGGSLAGAIQYNTDLFEPATIGRMAGHFRRS